MIDVEKGKIVLSASGCSRRGYAYIDIDKKISSHLKGKPFEEAIKEMKLVIKGDRAALEFLDKKDNIVTGEIYISCKSSRILLSKGDRKDEKETFVSDIKMELLKLSGGGCVVSAIGFGSCRNERQLVFTLHEDEYFAVKDYDDNYVLLLNIGGELIRNKFSEREIYKFFKEKGIEWKY